MAKKKQPPVDEPAEPILEIATPPPEPPRPLRLVYLDPSELDGNPANWREHPAEQLAGIEAAIDQVGWAGALLFNERTKRLIDGHARKEKFAGKGQVPVLGAKINERALNVATQMTA